MKFYDLTQPTPEERHDELVGYINELTDYVFNLEIIVLSIVRGCYDPKYRA